MINYEFFENREQWLSARKEGIGGSAVGTILGVNPWETAWQHWARITGRLPQKEENVAMDMGHRLEPVVVDLFRENLGVSIDERTATDFVIKNDDYPHFIASPDRIGTLATGEKFILECKTTAQAIDADELPKSWYCQLQFYMMVAGLKEGAIAWLERGRDFNYRHFHREDDFCQWMSAALEEWWQRHVIKGEEPPVGLQDVDIAYPSSLADSSVELSSEAYQAAVRLAELKAQIKSLETEAEKMTDFLKSNIQEAEIATFKGEKVATWKTSKPRYRFNESRFKVEHEAEYLAYCENKPGIRTFLLKI